VVVQFDFDNVLRWIAGPRLPVLAMRPSNGRRSLLPIYLIETPPREIGLPYVKRMLTLKNAER
jgi:hypothetical protein